MKLPKALSRAKKKSSRRKERKVLVYIGKRAITQRMFGTFLGVAAIFCVLGFGLSPMAIAILTPMSSVSPNPAPAGSGTITFSYTGGSSSVTLPSGTTLDEVVFEGVSTTVSEEQSCSTPEGTFSTGWEGFGSCSDGKDLAVPYGFAFTWTTCDAGGYTDNQIRYYYQASGYTYTIKWVSGRDSDSIPPSATCYLTSADVTLKARGFAYKQVEVTQNTQNPSITIGGITKTYSGTLGDGVTSGSLAIGTEESGSTSISGSAGGSGRYVAYITYHTDETPPVTTTTTTDTTPPPTTPPPTTGTLEIDIVTAQYYNIHVYVDGVKVGSGSSSYTLDPGTYTVSFDNIPSELPAIPDQSVTINVGEVTTLTIEVNIPTTGNGGDTTGTTTDTSDDDVGEVTVEITTSDEGELLEIKAQSVLMPEREPGMTDSDYQIYYESVVYNTIPEYLRPQPDDGIVGFFKQVVAGWVWTISWVLNGGW